VPSTAVLVGFSGFRKRVALTFQEKRTCSS